MLDEPTTGLSFQDVDHLLVVLQRLVDGGNTVVVIEHHLDVIKTADHIIDLGPFGGDRGGELIAVGTPEEIAANPESATGRYLRPLLEAAGTLPKKRKATKRAKAAPKRTAKPRKRPAKAREPEAATSAAK